VNENTSSSSSGRLTTGYEVDLFGLTSIPTVISGVGDGTKSNAAAAYSSVANRNLVAWQRFTSSLNDVWGVTATP
jgi:hypothetical protein